MKSCNHFNVVSMYQHAIEKNINKMVVTFNKLIVLVSGTIVDFHKNEYLLKKGSELNLVPSKNTLQFNSEYSLEKGHSLMIDNSERERVS